MRHKFAWVLMCSPSDPGVPPGEVLNTICRPTGRWPFGSPREQMSADEVHWLGKKARLLLDAYDCEQPPHTLRTFEQVEQFGETMVRPELPQFRSMQELQ